MSAYYFGMKPTPRKKWSSQDKREIIDLHPSCVYCGSDDYWDLVIDHIHPISQGGSSEMKNLTIACSLCNSHKWAFTIESFFNAMIGKRAALRADCRKYVFWLRSLRRGKKVHYMHDEDSICKKILAAKSTHSYYTKIISSLLAGRYQIF